MSEQPLRLLSNTLKISYQWLRSYIPCKRMLPQKRKYSTDNIQHTINNHTNNNDVHHINQQSIQTTNSTTTTLPWIILGLGNGTEYINTRHNIGQDIVDRLAQKYSHVSLFSRHNILKSAPTDPQTTPHDTVIKHHKCYYVVQHIAEQLCYIVITDTYMNNSGNGAKRLLQHLATQHNVTTNDLSQRFIVLYDELDLQCGTIRLSNSQHRASHNGISDIQRIMRDSQQFIRLRLGIGTTATYDMTDYVLEEFDTEQRGIMDKTIQRTIECIEYLVGHDLSRAMTRYNKTYEQFEALNNVDTEAIAAQRRAKRLKWEAQQAEKAKQKELKQQEHTQ